MSGLDSKRGEIRRLDEQILGLIGQRMALAGEIGRIKKDSGVPLRDWEVERMVLDQAEQLAAGRGVSRSLARSVMQLLIGESRAEQERQSYNEYSGSTEEVLIIGGRGKMGRWFADFLENQGHRVRIFDIRPGDSGERGQATLSESLKGTSFAIVAAPLDSVSGVIEECVACGYDGTIFDIASLKGHLKPAIDQARRSRIAITSVHPMFGPGTRALSDSVICLCDCGDAEATRRVRAFFSETAATLVELSLDEHDRIATYVLGLSHLLNIVAARVLTQSGYRFDELQRVGSTTFHSQMTTTATVIREDPRLYYSIQRLNENAPQLCESLRRELDVITTAVLRDEGASFAELMEAGRNWFERHDAD